jgi:hypothetical protein
MANANYLYTNYSLTELKEQVQRKSGVEISTMRNCSDLSEILASVNFHISPHTIARFFRIINSGTKPSQYTLDQFAHYVGYNGWNDFHNKVSNEIRECERITPAEKDPFVSESEMSLVRFCLQDGAFTPLTNYLRANREIFIDSHNPKTVGLLNTITSILSTYPKIRHKVLSLIVKEEYIGLNYFAHQINADAISTYFGDAISQYYMKMVNPCNNLYNSQVTWANSILMMEAFYKGNIKKFLQLGYELFRKSPPEENTTSKYLELADHYIWVFARYHYVHILYLYYSGKASNKVIEEKVRFIIDQLENTTYISKIVIFSFVFEALTFIGNSNLINYFTNYYFLIINSKDEINSIQGEALKALTAVIYYYTLATSSQITNSYKEVISTQINEIKDSIKQYSNFHHLYVNTYHVYLHLLEAILSEDPAMRQQYIADARQNALHLKNKFFIKQIDKLGT